jgi:hypothetical protein
MNQARQKLVGAQTNEAPICLFAFGEKNERGIEHEKLNQSNWRIFWRENHPLFRVV